jgi:hypothetical protein
MSTMSVVRIGRPTPWRSITVSLAIGGGAALIGAVPALLGPHPENTPLLLLFLLIPAAVIPIQIWQNSYAEFDPRTGLISISGAAPVPLAHITYARTMMFRGVSTLYLGVGPERTQRFLVANGPFGNPRIERDWVRHLLPYTGLLRRGDLPDPYSTTSVRGATFEETAIFARDYLK